MRALIIASLTLLFLISCSSNTKEEPQQEQKVMDPEIQRLENLDIQGHRGARGNAPENTIQAFMFAIESGVNTLELDVVLSQDSQLVVSHEPWMNPEICLLPDGSEIQEADAMKYNLYKMNYKEIKEFDCGTKQHPKFPDQKNEEAYKPLLAEVIYKLNIYRINEGVNTPLNYNIEIKSQAEGDGLYHPAPKEYVQKVLDVLENIKVDFEFNIQSFDPRILNELNRVRPDIKTAFLVSNDSSIANNLDNLDFTPDIYSPYFKLMDQEKVDYLHELGMEVIPWTVNDMAELRDVIDLGVDGVITDYPIRGVEIKQVLLAQAKGMDLPQ